MRQAIVSRLPGIKHSNQMGLNIRFPGLLSFLKAQQSHEKLEFSLPLCSAVFCVSALPQVPLMVVS